MSNELKPCPFCGANAELSNSWPLSFVRCKTCGVIGPDSVDENEAARKWNERSDCETVDGAKLVYKDGSVKTAPFVCGQDGGTFERKCERGCDCSRCETVNKDFCTCENRNDVKHKIIHECESLRELLISKNSNYGNSALTSPPFASVTTRDALMVRLGDKFNRLQTLSKGEPDKVGESINDTIRDIAGYCVLILIESKE